MMSLLLAKRVRLAATYAAILCLLSTFTCVLLFLFFGKHLNLVAYGSPIFWAVSAWVWKGSRIWSIAAFTVYVPLAILAVVSWSVLWCVVLPFAFLGLMHGVRAASALRRFENARLRMELRGRQSTAQ
jgi:hypothetical protein